MQHLIAERIKALRKERNMSQAEIAEKLNMSRQRYMRIESGQSDISYQVIVSIASLFGIDAASITNVITSEDDLAVMFRKNNGPINVEKHVKTIQSLLKTLYAHEKLYQETKQDND